MINQQVWAFGSSQAALKHLAEYPIGVVAAALGALAGLVIDPGEHDQLARCVVAEEEPVLLEEFRPQPVLVIVAQRGAMAVLRSGRVLRNDVEGQLDD